MSCVISPWALEAMTPDEAAEIRAYAKANRVDVNVTFTRPGRCYEVGLHRGRVTHRGHDQRRPIEAFRKALGKVELSGFVG